MSNFYIFIFEVQCINNTASFEQASVYKGRWIQNAHDKGRIPEMANCESGDQEEFMTDRTCSQKLAVIANRIERTEDCLVILLISTTGQLLVMRTRRQIHVRLAYHSITKHHIMLS